MMKTIAYLALMFLILTNCSKYRDFKEKDDFGDLYLRGRLFLYDTITQQAVGLPLGNKKIKVSYASIGDTSNHVFETTSDAEGYFVFKSLKKNVDYLLRYEEKIGEVKFTALDTFQLTASLDTARLIAQVSKNNQSGIHYTIKDINGGIIKNANVCIFTPSSFFKTGACEGALFPLKTNDYGRAFKGDVPPGEYYVTAYYTLNNRTIVANDTIVVQNEIFFDTLTLRPVERTGFQYKLLDENNTPIFGASLCVFSSLEAFKQDTCEGNSFTETSDLTGTALKTDMAPGGTFYIYASKKIGNQIFVAKDTLTIQANRVLEKTLVLRAKEFQETGINLTILDSAGTRIPEATLCFFTSRVLFDQGTCEGNNFQVKSNINGNAKQSGITPGTYYIYSSRTIGALVLESRTELLIEKNKTRLDTIQLQRKQ